MAARTPSAAPRFDFGGTSPRVLMVEARFYPGISDALAEGAIAALERAGVGYRRVEVPGALEIPAAVKLAEDSPQRCDGYVALGCVIRGETFHYDLVCTESLRGLQDLAVRLGLAVGNGILTVENEAQAWARARTQELDKGGEAAVACLTMIALKHRFSRLAS
jgi:6,7-dimethyl-8-ribityllumazine synthase